MGKNTESTTSTVESATSEDFLTPYGAHKIVNAALEDAGLTKRIPPQMMYNYTLQKVNQGKKPLIKFTPESGVDREDLQRWITSYVTKQKGAVATEEATEAEVEATEAE